MTVPSPSSLRATIRPYARAYAAGAAALIVMQLGMNRIDWLSMAAIDALFGPQPHDSHAPVIGIVAFAILAFVARIASRTLIFDAGRDVEYDLRARLVRRLHELGAAFYRTMSPGEIMSRASSDLAQVRLCCGFGVLNILNAAFAFVSALQVMVGISWRLTLASFVALPLLIPITRVMSRRVFLRTQANHRAMGGFTAALQSHLAGARVVRSFSVEAAEVRRIGRENDAYRDTSVALARTRSFLSAIIGVLNAVGLLAFFGYGGVLVLRGPSDGGISQGAFFAFWLALGRMAFPMIALGFVISIVQRGRAGFDRLREIFDSEVEVAREVIGGASAVAADLSVRNLSFSYGGREVLRRVSFDVPAGGTIAIVGKTGSGKSTLASLLGRSLPTPRGSVFLGQRDICDLPLPILRRTVGYAQQDPFLFSDTVSRNIGFAFDDPESADAQKAIIAAACAAQIDAEVLALPKRFDTVVGERGVQFSGGQKQRVALARALARPVPILVLDDPLSAVDPRTERRILDAIAGRGRSGALVLVTHRVAAAARCDEVLVVDGGRVVERGRHVDLVSAGGLYSAFAREQSAAEELEHHPALGVASVSEPLELGGARGGALVAREPERAPRTILGDVRLVRWLVPFLRAHARLLLLSLGALCIAAAANLLRPMMMGAVVARAGDKDALGLLRAGVLLAVVALAVEALRLSQSFAVQVAGARAMADVRTHIVRFFQRVELAYFDRTPIGRLVAYPTSDVEAVGDVFSSGVLDALADIVQLVGVVVMMVLLDYRLACAALAAVPVVALVVEVVRRRARTAFREIREHGANLSTFMNEQIGGIAVVQAFARERSMERAFDAINCAFRDASKRAVLYESLLDGGIELLCTLCLASILAWAGSAPTGRGVTFPVVVTFTEYIWLFFAPLGLLADRYMMLQAGLAGAERIVDLLGEAPVEKPAPALANASPRGPEDEVVAFDGVSFGYDAASPVLHDVEFVVKRGERIALVGATGAGKSTVASLALRLYELERGTIRVLGDDVRSYDREALRRCFAVVPQEVFLFGGTVLSNVAIGESLADRQRAEVAILRVGGGELLARPGGLDAVVDERGSNFSAGERQLLAFARALYRDAPVLLLDEATASMDSTTEARLEGALAAVMHGRTAIVIAHRLSTARAADRILVFHKGRIVEQGTDADLVAKGGVYARLRRAHFADAGDEPGTSSIPDVA